MTTATEPETAAEAPADKDRAKLVAALAKRLRDLDPDTKLTAEKVDAWDDATLAAVRDYLDEPGLDDVPDAVTAALGKGAPRFGFLALRQQNAKLRGERERIADARDALGEEIRELEDIKEEKRQIEKRLKAQQEVVDGSTAFLNSVIDDVQHGQGHLPFDDAAPADDPKSGPSAAEQFLAGAAAVSAALSGDPANAADLSALKPYGLTERQVELLGGNGRKTVAELLAFINSDPHWMRKITGFGPAGIDKLTDAITAWRRDNPAPETE